MKRYKLKNLRLTRVDRVPAGSNPDAHIVLFKAAEELPASDGNVADIQPVEDSMTDEATDLPEAADVEAPEAQLDESGDDSTQPEVTEEPAVEADAPDASVEQPAPELVAASAEDVEKADLRKSLEAAQAEIVKMKHEARKAEFIAKAKTDFDNLGTADEIGGLLLDAADNLSETSYQLLERTLKAANAQIGSGDLFKQLSDPAAEPAAVADKITVLAKELVEKGEAKNIGLAKMEVLKRNPELRDEYYSAAERA